MKRKIEFEGELMYNSAGNILVNFPSELRDLFHKPDHLCCRLMEDFNPNKIKISVEIETLEDK